MGTREGGRRPEGGNKKPAFIPLGSHPQTQHSSRLAAAHKPSIHPAWLPPTNPVIIPLGGHPQTQHLSRLAAARKTSIYPAWPPSTNPAFIPLGSRPQTQHSSRLAAAHNPSIHPAWQPSTNPAFIPLGARQIPSLIRNESLPPLAGDGAPMKKMLAFFSWVPGKVAEGRKGGIQTQYLYRLAAAHKPSNHPAWRLFCRVRRYQSQQIIWLYWLASPYYLCRLRRAALLT